MAFLQDEDAARAFEAALSFVDEYPFQDDEHAPSAAPESSAAAMVIGPQPAEADDKMQRKARANAKKRLLRKAGLYDDPNRARKERKLEMTYLQRKVEQLQLELQTLQAQHPQRHRRQAAGEQNRQQHALVTKQINAEVSSAWKEVASQSYSRVRGVGVAFDKLLLLFAVLEKRARVSCRNRSVFVNIAEGYTIQEPAADLAGTGSLLKPQFTKGYKNDDLTVSFHAAPHDLLHAHVGTRGVCE